MPTTQDDIELFKTVSDLLRQQQSEDSLAERRTQTRRPYQCVQLLAPYDGHKLPTQSGFQQVLCQDLSEHGFAFISHDRPETRWVIVALGAVPFLFFVAEIIHIEPAGTSPSDEFHVGCRFTRRVSRPDSARRE